MYTVPAHQTFVTVRRLAVLALLWAGVITAAPAGEEIKLPVSRDIWISAANASEVNSSMGKAPKMKLKTWQEFALVDFDTTALRGKKILSAELYVFPILPGKLDEKHTDLRWITLSTVTAPWEEGTGLDYDSTELGKGATCNEASFKTRAWAWPGSKVYDVILGNGNSHRDEVELQPAADGWCKLPVKLELLHSLVAGGSHGLLLMDGSTSPNFNSYLAQREAEGKGAYLLVQVAGEDTTPPTAVSGLKCTAEPNAASTAFGALSLAFNCTDDTAALQIQIDGADLPRYLIPQPKAGAMHFPVTDLPAGKEVQISVVAIDGAGNRATATTAKATTSPVITVPKLPPPAWTPKGGEVPIVGEQLRVWAIPELVKTDPKTGAARLDGNAIDFSIKSAVFDGADSTIHLAAARAEIVSFQVVVQAVKGTLNKVAIDVSDLKAGENILANKGVKLWRIWYVDGEAEYAAPLGATFDIPAKDNKVKDQATQQITVDFFVPKDTPPGLYKGQVKVTAAGDLERILPFEIKVYAAVIPDVLNFNPELNCYGPPGGAGTTEFFDYHRIAHYNRCTLNTVPYSQNGKTKGTLAPVADEKGRVTDWSAYDKTVGPLLTGEAFRGNPRAGVPVRTYYLPHFENWPMNLRAHYNAGPNVQLPDARTEEREWKDVHDYFAPPIEKCFDEAYPKAWTASIQEFVAHFEKQGYTKSTCELYLNNKYSTGKGMSSLWVLDEPTEYLDWAAIKYYSDLFHAGIKDIKRPDFFVFRGDISRPQWQGNLLDGGMEYLYCNSKAFSMSRLIRNIKQRTPTEIYIYGSANDPRRNAYETTAWCYQSLVQCDGTGVLPWQCLGNADALLNLGKEAEQALLVDGKALGVSAVASIRVHAFRRGAQDNELLMALRQKHGWSSAHLEALVAQKLDLNSDFKQAKADDASAVTFKPLAADTFAAIKEGVLQLLEK